jgi:hypothetical protein
MRDDDVVFELSTPADDREERTVMTAGSRATISATMENPLAPGRYAIVCYVGVSRNEQEAAQQSNKLLDLLVFGTATASGIVSVPGEVGISLDDREGQEVRR